MEQRGIPRKYIDGEPRISKKGKPKRYSTSRTERTPEEVTVSLYRSARAALRRLPSGVARSVAVTYREGGSEDAKVKSRRKSMEGVGKGYGKKLLKSPKVGGQEKESYLLELERTPGNNKWTTS